MPLVVAPPTRGESDEMGGQVMRSRGGTWISCFWDCQEIMTREVIWSTHSSSASSYAPNRTSIRWFEIGLRKLVAAMGINVAMLSGWLTSKRVGLELFRSQGEPLHILISAAACFANTIGFIWFPFDLRALSGFAGVGRGLVRISRRVIRPIAQEACEVRRQSFTRRFSRSV